MTVACAFGQDIVSENVMSAPQPEGRKWTKRLEEASQINPLGAILPVLLMECSQPLTLSHRAPFGSTLQSLETSRQD